MCLVAVDKLAPAVNYHVPSGMQNCELPRAFGDALLRAFRDENIPKSLALQGFQKP